MLDPWWMRPLTAVDCDRCRHHQHPTGSIKRVYQRQSSSLSTSSSSPLGHEAFTVTAPPKNAGAWHLTKVDGQDHRRSMNPTTQAFDLTHDLRLGTTPGMAARRHDFLGCRKASLRLSEAVQQPREMTTSPHPIEKKEKVSSSFPCDIGLGMTILQVVF